MTRDITIKHPAADIQTLPELAIDINHEYACGLSMAQRATESMIKVGKLLLEARMRFKGDLEFGRWRKKTVEFSGSHASRLMAVARDFGEIQDAHLLPISTLAELLPADKRLKDEIIKQAKNGTVATVKEVREKVKGEKPENIPVTPATDPRSTGTGDGTTGTTTATAVRVGTGAGVSSRAASAASREAGEGGATDPIDRMSAEIGEPLIDRLKNSIDSFIIFGLTPMFDGTYNEVTLMILYDAYCETELSPKNQKSLDRAYADIKHQLFSTVTGVQGSYK